MRRVVAQLLRPWSTSATALPRRTCVPSRLAHPIHAHGGGAADTLLVVSRRLVQRRPARFCAWPAFASCRVEVPIAVRWWAPFIRTPCMRNALAPVRVACKFVLGGGRLHIAMLPSLDLMTQTPGARMRGLAGGASTPAEFKPITPCFTDPASPASLMGPCTRRYASRASV
ncbi:hypothetical protein DFH08DRAFT_1079152 [Mycena albidolilacea]|uniref:Uncharacterized protein n=1 Tax=Mycena albidolilacea TaxID=1033008 RepID=A0AAD7A5I3_9AGAR|nr:hypothetical protein DFH08DRAFT_1079152 [Mycena albidolilacea]